MARSTLLADKYAQYKGNVNNRPSWRSASLPIKKSYPRIPNFYDDKEKESKLPGLFGSPIKTLRTTPSRAARPSSIYKMLPYLPSRNSLPIKPTFRPSLNERYSKIQKDRSWLESRKKDNKLKLEGFISRLRGLIPNLSLHGESIKSLSASAKEVLKIPSMSRSDDRSTVSVDLLIAPRYSRSAVFGEFDEVDAGVQLAKNKIANERKRREDAEQKEAMEKLENELRTVKEKHERELYLVKADHEAKLAELSSQIAELTALANAKRGEIEREKLLEIENTVLQNNESFLVYQRETEKKLEQHSRELQVKEQELARKERDIESLLARETQTSRLAKKLITESQKIPELIPNSRLPLESRNTSKYGLLNAMKLQLASAVKTNDEITLKLYDTMQKVSERIMSEPSQSDTNVLLQLEELVQTLDQPPEKPKDRFAATLKEYETYFDKFGDLFRHDPSKARKVYDTDNLNKMIEFFQELREKLENKFTRKQAELKSLRERTELVSVDSVRDVRVIQIAAKDTKRAANLLAQQETLVSNLEKLAELQSKARQIKLKTV